MYFGFNSNKHTQTQTLQLVALDSFMGRAEVLSGKNNSKHIFFSVIQGLGSYVQLISALFVR